MAMFSRLRSRGHFSPEGAALESLFKSQAMIEFDLTGTIITANANFLELMGYTLAEVQGQHHRMFVEPETAQSADYAAFWANLRAGQFSRGEFRRRTKSGAPVWIEGSYNPVFDAKGMPVKIIKVASDVTSQRQAAADLSSQLEAIGKSQAVIEFALDGTILNVNDNFCQAMGYRAAELVGRHHRMFITPAQAASRDYTLFWERLGAGEFQAGEFQRVGKDGRQVWIQASYNPIFNLEGKPYKVVKFATDVTGRKLAVNALGQGLTQFAEGDLSVQLNEQFVGELEVVRQAFNSSVARFADVVGQLRAMSSALKAATGEMMLGANDLSGRTNKQASTIQETSTTITELARTVAANASMAQDAAAKARAVSQAAAHSGNVMGEANGAMERITQSSSKISSIIGLIDDVAFQTNLLALNASVEAARAGDAGRGFAVVAVEVRRLAQSAAAASAEVKALVQQSAAEVQNGSQLVSAAAERLASMLGSVDQSSALVDRIAAASREQAASIEEVSGAVRQLDEMTQHNASLVDQTNAAVEQTELQAHELDAIVDVFRFGPPAAAGIKPVRRAAA